jgi:hypothetical protein
MNPEQPTPPSENISLADLIVDLNFVPAWAREEQKPAAARGGERGEAPREQRPMPRRDFSPKEGRRSAGGRRRERDRERRVRAEGADMAEPERFPVRVRFIPDRKALGTAARDLYVSKRAAPLPQLASIFLNGQTSCVVKMELQDDSKSADNRRLFVCKVCRQVFREYAGAFQHAVGAHLDQHFRREERVVEAPSGLFSCVGRCRLSGEVLGPPNHHSYNERFMDLYRRRFSHLSLDEYRQHIELVRDPQLIEQWQEQARKQEVFFPLNEADGKGEMSRRDAERIFAERYARGLIKETRQVLIPRQVAMALEDTVLARAVRHYAQREAERPFSMMLALRAAFHHMDFHTFRARGQVFVTAVEPRPLNPAHAVKPVAEIIEFLQRHPGCTRHEAVARLRPNAPVDAPEVSEVLRHLAWLIEKGHVIEFFNGTLAVPHLPAPSPTPRREEQHGEEPPRGGESLTLSGDEG